MRNKYGIGFLSIVFILALAVTFAGQYGYRAARKKVEARLWQKRKLSGHRPRKQ